MGNNEMKKYKISDNSFKNFPMIVSNSKLGKYHDTKMQDTQHDSTNSPTIV